MIWISYYKRHLQYLWSSYFIPLIIIHLLDVVRCEKTGECLQIFQCPDLTADLFNLTVPDFAAKYQLRCSRHDSGYQGVCCPMQNPSFNTINQNEDIESIHIPYTSTKTVTHTTFSTIPQIFTRTKTFTDISTKTVTDFSTKIQTKVATKTFVRENTKIETEKIFKTLTNTITKTINNLSTKTITKTNTQHDTKELRKTDTVYVTDTFTERVPVTHILFKTSTMRATTVTVTLPPVTTTVQIRSALNVRPITRYRGSPFRPIKHRSEISTTILPDPLLSGLRAKKESNQKQNDIPDGFVELFGRVVRLPKNGDLQMNWTESIEHCESFDSKAFVPKAAGDWTWLQDIAKELDDTMWMPANDLDNEGSIIWTDNTVASQNWISWWQIGGGNRDADDCMLMWNTDGKVEMVPCSYREYPAVCQF
ncbi:unnamed protein product [Meganyctiphanes norvegica]|uniref:C-type lectin domain-containing protein n=1 Tax=Meganyctiphanes norvegica TaxID=48144 RepID=A0AAV2QET2_MEGNR